jgi:hypothetical protein
MLAKRRRTYLPGNSLLQRRPKTKKIPTRTIKIKASNTIIIIIKIKSTGVSNEKIVEK